VARTFGLPGVTYDLCARELDDCQAGCRGGSVAASSDAGVEVVAAGVVWDEAASKLRCPLETTSLDVPAALRESVRKISEGEAQLVLASAGLVSLSAGRGDAPEPFGAWAALHQQLSPLEADEKMEVKSAPGPDQAWTFEYAVVRGETKEPFRVALRTVRKAGGYCRVIAIERAAEHRATALLAGFR
jgi:hypothetical protein